MDSKEIEVGGTGHVVFVFSSYFYQKGLVFCSLTINNCVQVHTCTVGYSDYDVSFSRKG
jgi:hypothetical protein